MKETLGSPSAVRTLEFSTLNKTDIAVSFGCRAGWHQGGRPEIIALAPDLSDVEFVPRLIHAGREQFRIVVEMIIGAITRALADEKPAVGLKDFAHFYAERTGDILARNPFLVPDFRSIPTGRTPPDPEPPTPPKGRPKKPRGRR